MRAECKDGGVTPSGSTDGVERCCGGETEEKEASAGGFVKVIAEDSGVYNPSDLSTPQTCPAQGHSPES